MQQFNVPLAVADQPNANGDIFPESVLREALHQFRGKPVFSRSSGRRIGTISGVAIVSGTARQGSVFTPGRREVGDSPQLIVSVEADDTYPVPTDPEAVSLWEGSRDSSDQRRISRALFHGVVVEQRK